MRASNARSFGGRPPLVAWAAAAAIALAAAAVSVLALRSVSGEARVGAGVYLSPEFGLTLLAISALPMVLLLWDFIFARGLRLVVVGVLAAASVLSFFAAWWWLGHFAPAYMGSIREVDGQTVILGIDPAWDVRSYRLYEPAALGLLWRERPSADATFWEYPYKDEMRLGLDRQGRALILNPRGQRGPFPDGLTTFACPSSSPPGCVRRR